jgi:hypothetical protein
MPNAPDQPFWSNPKASNGLHALLVGVSRYPFAHGGDAEHLAKENFGIGQLSAPARTVMDLANWLIQNSDALVFPLKSIRLLASPSKGEIDADGALAGLPEATLKNVGAAAKAWRADAAESKDSAALFYFAGHGIQRTRGDSVLLLQDFLDPASGTDLERTVSVINIYNGMANFTEFPNLARTQFYFIDACRSDIPQLAVFETQEPTALFRIEKGGVDDRTAPIFFASVAGRETYGVKGGQTLFGRDLLSCLSGGGADKVNLRTGQNGWYVTLDKLVGAMSMMVNSFNADYGYQLRSLNVDKLEARTLGQLICSLPSVPKVSCKLELLPEQAASFVSIKFDTPYAQQPFEIMTPGTPYTCVKEAGIYAIDGSVVPSHRNLYKDYPRALVHVEPPFFNHSLQFS